MNQNKGILQMIGRGGGERLSINGLRKGRERKSQKEGEREGK